MSPALDSHSLCLQAGVGALDGGLWLFIAHLVWVVALGPGHRLPGAELDHWVFPLPLSILRKQGWGTAGKGVRMAAGWPFGELTWAQQEAWRGGRRRLEAGGGGVLCLGPRKAFWVPQSQVAVAETQRHCD